MLSGNAVTNRLKYEIEPMDLANMRQNGVRSRVSTRPAYNAPSDKRPAVPVGGRPGMMRRQLALRISATE
jgi:hypothetical protein